MNEKYNDLVKARGEILKAARAKAEDVTKANKDGHEDLAVVLAYHVEGLLHAFDILSELIKEDRAKCIK